MSQDQNIEEKNEVEVINVNNEKINKNPIGFEKAKSNKKKMVIKKTTESIAKLMVIVAAALTEMPIVSSALSKVTNMKAQDIIKSFSNIKEKIKLPNSTKEQSKKGLGANIFQNKIITSIVEFCQEIAKKHSTKIIAGGSILTGLLTSKIIYPIIKKIVRIIKGAYNNEKRNRNANETQLEIYKLIKSILKHNNYKKIKNHQTFSKTLNNAAKMTEISQEYEEELINLLHQLQEIYGLLDNNQINDFIQASINIETTLKGIEYKSYSENYMELQPQRAR